MTINNGRKVHIWIWSLYIVYEVMSIGIIFNDFGSPIKYLSHYAIVILAFYFNANIALPYAIGGNKKSVIVVMITILFELTLYIIAQYLVSVLLIKLNISKTEVLFDVSFIIRNFYRGLLFLGFSTGYYYLKNFLIERKKTAQLEKQRLENVIEQQRMEQELVLAENAFLKAQINPHFLFNTLSFIHYKVSAHSEVAGEAIIKLSEMMRFAIDADDTGNHIALANEIEQVENLIYLYQIRKSAPLQIYFTYTNEIRQLRLIPLVLLTLAENIFKHADIYNEKDPAYLNLKVVDGVFHLDTGNRLALQQASPSSKSGLTNIQKRLFYAYGDAVNFNYHTSHTHFNLSITVPISLLQLKTRSVVS
jgi:two-component system, LytTR family, sensor kinase